jgi:hypothetical protein
MRQNVACGDEMKNFDLVSIAESTIMQIQGPGMFLKDG